MLKMIKIQKVKSLLDLVKINKTNTKENLNETHYLTI
ncbi:TPA: hypothetical protein ACTOCS_001613 [Campylobacter jejuni]